MLSDCFFSVWSAAIPSWTVLSSAHHQSPQPTPTHTHTQRYKLRYIICTCVVLPRSTKNMQMQIQGSVSYSQSKYLQTYLVFQKADLLISEFCRSPLAPKDSQLFKDAKLAIACKKKERELAAYSTKHFIYWYTTYWWWRCWVHSLSSITTISSMSGLLPLFHEWWCLSISSHLNWQWQLHTHLLHYTTVITF